jgi:hydroxymethylbilane synthase
VTSTLRLGTRGSPLALYQARAVAALLQARASTACDIVVIKTSGDQLADANLSEAGGKRLFVKEIEDALLAGEVDLAVHSSKDMAAVLPEGLEIGAVLPREDARDALVLPAGRDAGSDIEAVSRALGPAPRIGTSSVRRAALLRQLAPAGRFLPVRGNLETRLRKLDSGDYDALVLAAAGMRRLGYERRLSASLPIELCVPAPGQGIIAVEVRRDDHAVSSLVATIDDAAASAALRAERALVERLGGGCQMPLGAYARIEGDLLIVSAVVTSLDGADAVRTKTAGSLQTPDLVGARAAEALLAQGADRILADVRRSQSAAEGHRR